MHHQRYYGWTMTWTFALTETVSWGILFYAFSALLVPMQDELGWSTTAITGAYSLSMLMSGIIAPLVGRWLDLHGPRAIMTIGSIAGTALVLLWSRIETLPGFYALWIGIGLVSATTLYEPAFTALAHWFDRDRGKAMLIVTIAGGFASTIFLPLTGWLAGITDWRTALVILAIILGLATIPPHALLLRRRPEDVGQQVDGRRPQHDPAEPATRRPPAAEPGFALRSPGFRWMTAAYFLQTLATIAITVHLIAYLTGRGDGATFAATATGLIGAAQVAARIVTTLLERRVSLIGLTALVFALQALAFVVLVLWVHPAGVLVSVILLGIGRGAVTLIRPSTLIALYGSANFGVINGWQNLVLALSRAAAPVAAGAAYALAGGYAPVIWALAVCSLVSAVAMLRVPALPVK